MASVDRRIGDSIGGYKVTGVLGRGGSGAVYRVVDSEGHSAALKLVDAKADAVAATRLEREVAALQSLRHRAVPRVIDAELDGDETFVVFELVHGDSLFHYIQEHGPLDGEELASFAEQMASALEAAHAAGVVHRDVTPSNVMMGPAGPVLIDFGLSHRQNDERLTRDGLVSGTAGYVAPEVIDGADPGPSADVWSWAATVAYAMSGTAPFGSGSKAIGRTLDSNLTLASVTGSHAVAAALGRKISARPGMRDVVAALRGATTVLDSSAQAPVMEPTAVMAGTPGVHASFAAVDPAVATDDAPESWETVTTGDVARRRSLDAHDDHADDDADEEEPRSTEIPLARRRTVLVVWAMLLAVSGAVGPVVAFAVMVILSIIARTAHRRARALDATRSRKGVRRSDTVVHTIGLPWYLLRATAESLPSVLLATVAGVGTTALAWWLVSTEYVVSATTSAIVLGHAIALALGGIVTVAMLAWGPLTSGTRAGAYRVAYLLAPTRSVATLWVVVAIAGIAVVVLATYLQADPWWWPLPSLGPGTGPSS